MKYYFLDTAGDLNNEDLCFFDKAPKWLGISWYRMADGTPAWDVWDDDPKIYMTEDNPGIKLESLIGNTKSYLIVHREVQAVIEPFCKKLKIEYLPLVIYNHRHRPHSRDYVIVNPIGCFDALDLDKSEIEYLNNDKNRLIGIDRYVLQPSKLKNAPALFRLPENPTEYIMNEALVRALSEDRFTNMFFREIEQSDD